MRTLKLTLLLAAAILLPEVTSRTGQWMSCPELTREIRYPCDCRIESANSEDIGIAINCDHVVFVGDFPSLPYGVPIVGFSQRYSGHQALPTQIFSQYGLPLKRLDFSSNNLRRLPERLLTGVQATLTHLVLADNLLGDGLNPIFSTAELHGLTHLSVLDLSGNGIRGIEEGILKGCDNLAEFRLDKNSLAAIPSSSLNGPKTLKILSLIDNRITRIRNGAFLAQRSLENINLRGNMLTGVEGGSFEGLTHLRQLSLARNRLQTLNSDAFQGAEKLDKLDLAENFIHEFPSVALKVFTGLKHLNLSTNMITHLDQGHLSTLVSLQALDLSRNNIGSLASGIFSGLNQLRYLDIGVNTLRTVEDDVFEGLNNLETLLLRDNNILLIPASAFSRLPRLTSVHLGFNRITALSSDILRSMADHVSSLVLSRNVIRELPSAAFQHFKQLTHLDLSGNLLNTLGPEAFVGLETTLEYLSLSENRILNFVNGPLQLDKLWFLDLSGNQIAELPKSSFYQIPNLAYFNVSRNPNLQVLPPALFHNSPELTTVDLSHIGLKTISNDLFSKSKNVEYINLSNNALQEIPEGTFLNLGNLTTVDLSNNRILNMRQSAFVNVMNIKYLYLQGNQLNAFKGEFFNTGTSLEEVDLSDNQLSYLFPSSFKIHPRLKKIIAPRNKFNFFPAELIASLQFLEHIDLSGNELKTIDELDFARLPKLRTLLMNDNDLESVSEMAFHNSTQLQFVDFANNRLDRLGERLFEGVARLQMLNLDNNLLTELPDNIFERSRLQMLENIKLSNNQFEIAPLRALQKQYFFVNSVDLSHNSITDIPPDDSIMVNIKKLDLSFNPLSLESISNILGEPKTVRDLNLAGTGIVTLFQLETPFLHHLNISYNNISAITEKVFERTTLLETLDLSNNNVKDLTPLAKVWSRIKNIQALNLSCNPITTISKGDFMGLESLKLLRIEHLEECTIIEKNAFAPLSNLVELYANDYPRLGYFDVQGILHNLPILQKLDIEVKDAAIGSDQLQSALHPRLEELGIRGSRLRSISSGALAGLKGQSIAVRLRNTSLSSIPPALLFPLPRSSRVLLDVSGSKLTSLQPQLLVSLDDRRADLSMLGLDTNPIHCDCGARALRRWLPGSKMLGIRCSTPEHLATQLLVEIGDDELTCDPIRPSTTTTTTTATPSKPPRTQRTTFEPDIIWSVPPVPEEKITKAKNSNIKGAPITSQSLMNNDDTLIIGIVGGVVAFIAILVMIICIVRWKMSSTQYRGGPLVNGNPMGPMNGLTPIYAVPPSYASGYSGAVGGGPISTISTLPHKGHGPPSGTLRPPYATVGRVPYHQQYFVSIPHDEKIYR